MFNRFDRNFAFQAQGGNSDWEGWTPPWMRREHHHHHHHGGPRFFGMRFGRGLFGPGGPFGQEGPFAEGGRRFFGRGDLKFALLELVQERPMHGYEMMKALEEKSGGFYVPSAGSIYPTLQMLEDRGLVTVQEVESKKVYSITDTGRAFLAERKKAEEEQAGPDWGGPHRGGQHRGGPNWGGPNFGPAARRWSEPEIQALRSEAMEVARLFSIAGRMSFRDPKQVAHLRGIIEHSRKELSDMIYGQGGQPAENPTTPPTSEQA